MYNPYPDDFPILQKSVNGKRLVYLDNAATTQKPNVVLDALHDYYCNNNANPHRGAYTLSVQATELYEEAREAVRAFVGAAKPQEIVFTKNATEAFNLLAYSYGMDVVGQGDDIVISIAEHHSNLVPWQHVTSAKGANLTYLYTDQNGYMAEDEIERKITAKTKIVSVTHVSNVFGSVNPVKQVVEKAHSVGAVVIFDLSQSIAHMKIDVGELGADFAVFTGHKMYAPMGIGVLYGKEKYLQAMPPFLFGGDMIESVSEQGATFAPLPQKFEGGTQNVGGAVGLAAAIRYIKGIGFDEIERVENELTAYTLQRLGENPYITLQGSTAPQNRTGIISFRLSGVHPHDVASILDADGIAIRSGHHCAHPLMKYLGITATARISLCFYNTAEDIDTLAESLKQVRRWLHLESE